MYGVFEKHSNEPKVLRIFTQQEQRTNLIKLQPKSVPNETMEVRRIQEEINHLLIKLEEQYGRILTYNDSIPVLEVDLATKVCWI